MISLEPPRGIAEGDDGWAALGLSHAGLTRFVKSARGLVGLAGEVDVLLADDRTLRRLNREFRGKDKATDVLSFPAAEELAAHHAGDLAVSVETAARQGREHGHDLATEVRVLLLHGLLHLSGMDHETDRGEMRAREAELRKRLRLPGGLVERVEGSAAAQSVVAAPRGSRSRAGMTTRKAKAAAAAEAEDGGENLSLLGLEEAVRSAGDGSRAQKRERDEEPASVVVRGGGRVARGGARRRLRARS